MLNSYSLKKQLTFTLDKNWVKTKKNKKTWNEKYIQTSVILFPTILIPYSNISQIKRFGVSHCSSKRTPCRSRIASSKLNTIKGFLRPRQTWLKNEISHENIDIVSTEQWGWIVRNMNGGNACNAEVIFCFSVAFRVPLFEPWNSIIMSSGLKTKMRPMRLALLIKRCQRVRSWIQDSLCM